MIDIARKFPRPTLLADKSSLMSKYGSKYIIAFPQKWAKWKEVVPRINLLEDKKKASWINRYSE